MVKINDNERACLMALASEYDSDMNCLYMREVARRTGLDEKLVRRSVRSLGRKGLALYVRGLFNEDGQVAGSGYQASREGWEMVSADLEAPHAAELAAFHGRMASLAALGKCQNAAG